MSGAVKKLPAMGRPSIGRFAKAATEWPALRAALAQQAGVMLAKIDAALATL